MTPEFKNKLRNAAQARSIQVLLPMAEAGTQQRIESTHYVEGYAARFEPYVLWEDEDGPIYERFDPGCFAGADMTDVIMQFDHAGRVYARTSNGSLILWVDDNGLGVAADLSRTEGGRQLYEDIKAGMVTKMSWRFTVGDYEYDPDTRTIVHHTVKKVWDVSSVSIPANDTTEINARSFGDGVIAEAARSEAELEARRRRLRLKININMEENTHAHN